MDCYFKRTVHIVLLCMVGLTALTMPIVPWCAEPPIRIGEINPLTGKLAKHGQEIHEGIVYAVLEVNGKGGILGRRVELFSRDDQSLPETAVNQAEDLLYRVGVAGLVGGYVDSLVGPISEVAARHHTPYVASASLQRNLTRGRRNPYFFRVAHLDGIVGPLSGFVSEVLRPRTAAILYSSTPGSTELGEEMRRKLEGSGVRVVMFEKFRPGTPDFSPFLMKLRMTNADILISGGFFPDHLILARQLSEQRLKLKGYLGPWGVAYPSFIETLGSAAEGLFGLCAWNPGITLPGTEKGSAEFLEGFQKHFGRTPNTTTMHGYASCMALLTAMDKSLQRTGELRGENTCEELRRLDILLPMERLAFDEHGDPRHYRQVVVQIQKGRMVVVYPPERATGKILEEPR